MGYNKSRNHRNPPRKKKLSLKTTRRETYNSWRNIVEAPIVLVELIDTINAAGGAVMLTRSSDGGALGIRIYHDDVEAKTAWVTDPDEFEDLLEIVYEHFGNSDHGYDQDGRYRSEQSEPDPDPSAE